ncbi:MAG: glycosyltransferase family protein [Rhodospirillales bacterium]|jgi:Tfp pilus assembly protein PilF|nr:glycosyltransferase family protein [Rhodospirillales bacterium]MBT4006938.1 glycosyltransferase family protein [Rhodospirillales bacterium]MBT5113035.1 glycosyltransferase family protein [Rhodospirillales bacterium]MBT5672911.1 glycosyltransferase family protein [Rhodospirillales bacterium]MBT6187588.1 glycosyltransferase family protein [Rhodospirillales bacterium]
MTVRQEITIAKRPDPLEAGLFHHRAGNIAKAEAAYRRVLSRDPKNHGALHLLALATLDKGRGQRALQLVEKALKLAPDGADYLHSAGHILAGLGQLEEAVARYKAALAQDPKRPLTLSNLGNVLKRLGHYDDAADHLSRAVILDPEFAAGWSNLGLVHRERGDFDGAFAAFLKAIAITPNEPGFHYNLANARMADNDTAGAITCYNHALSLNPTHLSAHMNLGAALRQTGNLAGAITHLETATRLSPTDAEAHWNLGLAQLMGENWATGWAEYEWRRKMPSYGLAEPDQPIWNGTSLEGARLLILHEQGFGDALQFMRFAAYAKALGGHVIYQGPKPMLPIIGAMAGVDETCDLNDPPPPFDAFVPMMSIPHILKLDGASLAQDTYLSAKPDHNPLAHIDGLKVGIAWQGNQDYRLDRERSIPLHHFESLAKMPGVTLIGLQKGEGTEQIKDWPSALPFVDLGTNIDAEGGAFMETAAIMGGLDCVVTSDTALAHLAGAMGKPVHVALAHVPDWRWGLEGSACVWYPTMTLHRQTSPGD